jgi:hypothetical protein
VHDALGVLGQFVVRDGLMHPVEPTDNIDPNEGFRITDSMIQFGLTRNEVDAIIKRQQRLIERIERGKIELF